KRICRKTFCVCTTASTTGAISSTPTCFCREAPKTILRPRLGAEELPRRSKKWSFVTAQLPCYLHCRSEGPWTQRLYKTFAPVAETQRGTRRPREFAFGRACWI